MRPAGTLLAVLRGQLGVLSLAVAGGACILTAFTAALTLAAGYYCGYPGREPAALSTCHWALFVALAPISLGALVAAGADGDAQVHRVVKVLLAFEAAAALAILIYVEHRTAHYYWINGCAGG